VLSNQEKFQAILNAAIETLTTEKITKLLLATDNKGRTVIHVAAKLSQLEVYKGIMNLVKENLAREEVNKLLLATYNDGRSFFFCGSKVV